MLSRAIKIKLAELLAKGYNSKKVNKRINGNNNKSQPSACI